ncbi:MAG: glycosyltransferase [Malacoplasma sp.]
MNCSKKNRIIHINCLDTGSTGKIIVEITKGIHNEWDSLLCCPKKNVDYQYLNTIGICFNHEQGIYKRINYLYCLRFGFAPIATCKLLNVIKEFKPDVVHIHSPNVNMINVYKLLNFLKANKITTVITNHSELFYTGNCTHSLDCSKWESGCGNCEHNAKVNEALFFDRTSFAWGKMKNCFKDFEMCTVVSVSPWQFERSKKSPILEGIKQVIINNGINTNVFHYENDLRLRKELNLTEEIKLVVHVTARFSLEKNDIKGGYYFKLLADRFKEDNVIFIVVGHSEENIIKDSNIIFLGNIKDQQQLARIFSQADLTVVASKKETFGMTVIESLCCGTPVIGFKAGGPESITMDNYSKFISYGDIDQLEITTRKFLNRSFDKQEISNEAIEIYDSDIMAKKYEALYDSKTKQ